jgi:hypothetical protein
VGAMKTDETALYVTLVEAAREIDESPDVLRQAVKRNEIRAVRENPANKRSRWLVALEDVKRLYGTEPDVAEIPESVPSIHADETGPTVVESADNGAPMALPIPTRGEELVERFTNAVDRLTDSFPEAPFNYQTLLDKYVAAVERAAEADVEAATLKRRMDDLNNQLATTIDRLDDAHAENRQLLTELDSARSDLAASPESRSSIRDRPLWKKRNR